MLEQGRNCWRIERASRASLIVDAADYFRFARNAMLKARSQLLLIGWDFDTRIGLEAEAADGIPSKLGAFLTWLARRRPELSIYILNWDLGTAKLLVRGTTVLRLARWIATGNIYYRLDGAHPASASHHQKIVVVDDSLAFCGGIDMTASRWDTRDHRDQDKRRKRPTTGRSYGPWHDATMAVAGPIARALGELARERWKAAGGKPIEPPEARDEVWPDGLGAHFSDQDVAIARTRSAYRNAPEVREIEALYLDMIARASRYIYMENQYFASRRIAGAMASRLAEADGPEIIVVNPKSAEGWLEDEVMSSARAMLVQKLRTEDRHGRFRIYTPVTQAGEDIYVHSKITVVDDEVLRVGSANINNRSMGLDSECDLAIDCRSGAVDRISGQISTILVDLLGEHLNVTPAELKTTIGERGSLHATIDALRGRGRTLVALEVEPPNELEHDLVRNEVLDPESATDAFEPMTSSRWSRLLRRRS